MQIGIFVRVNYIKLLISVVLGDPEVSRACVEVLLELSPLLPNLLKGVHSRLASQPAAIREEFTGRLEALKRQYQTNMLL